MMQENVYKICLINDYIDNNTILKNNLIIKSITQQTGNESTIFWISWDF